MITPDNDKDNWQRVLTPLEAVRAKAWVDWVMMTKEKHHLYSVALISADDFLKEFDKRFK